MGQRCCYNFCARRARMPDVAKVFVATAVAQSPSGVHKWQLDDLQTVRTPTETSISSPRSCRSLPEHTKMDVWADLRGTSTQTTFAKPDSRSSSPRSSTRSDGWTSRSSRPASYSSDCTDDKESNRLETSQGSYAAARRPSTSSYSSRRPSGASLASIEAIGAGELLMVAALESAFKHSGSFAVHTVMVRVAETPDSLEQAWGMVEALDPKMPPFEAKVYPDNVLEQLPNCALRPTKLTIQRVVFMGTEWLGLRMVKAPKNICLKFCLCATALQNEGKKTSRSVAIVACDPQDKVPSMACAPMAKAARNSCFLSWFECADGIADLCEILSEGDHASKRMMTDLKRWSRKMVAELSDKRHDSKPTSGGQHPWWSSGRKSMTQTKVRSIRKRPRSGGEEPIFPGFSVPPGCTVLPPIPLIGADRNNWGGSSGSSGSPRGKQTPKIGGHMDRSPGRRVHSVEPSRNAPPVSRTSAFKRRVTVPALGPKSTSTGSSKHKRRHSVDSSTPAARTAMPIVIESPRDENSDAGSTVASFDSEDEETKINPSQEVIAARQLADLIGKARVAKARATAKTTDEEVVEFPPWFVKHAENELQ